MQIMGCKLLVILDVFHVISPHPHFSLQHLIESLWYAVLETFILLAAFHQELNFSFVTIVMTLFVVKSFHWLANDRIDFVSQPSLIILSLARSHLLGDQLTGSH